jgi:activator of HSP90 ATPase
MLTFRREKETMNTFTRREFSLGLAALVPMFGACPDALAVAHDEITRTSEAIHQEMVFPKANCKRVYDALTDTQQFAKVTEFSRFPGAADISRDIGGAFSLFGGHITGRHLELLPNERIVQAWRAGSWPPGAYSIARFDFKQQGDGTQLVFDHLGFPRGLAEHLLEGWNSNYWQPLQKYLS